MRTLTSTCAASAVLAASLLLAPAAYAHNAPGDNGTVKIHDAKTGEALVRNEPHVCTFYLDAFGFDGGQQVDWKIVEWPPTGTMGKRADSGVITLDSRGHGRTHEETLRDGHYKLYWNFDGEKGEAKQKVFWVDCATSGGPNPSASAPGSTPSKPGEGGAQPGTSTAPGHSGSQPGASAKSGSGHLAETGASTAVPAGIALLLIGVGGTVMLAQRRRDRVRS